MPTAPSRSRRARSVLLPAAVALVSGGLAPPLTAEAQMGVRVLPQVGLYAGLSDLGEVRENGRTVVGSGRKSSTLAVGAAVEVGPLRGGGALRGQVGYATASPLSVRGDACAPCSARGAVLTATLAAVFRPLPRLLFVRPELILGAGVKRHDFDLPGTGPDAEDLSVLLRDQARLSGQFGAGLEILILGRPTRWELSGFVSRFEVAEAEGSGSARSEGDLQTDLFVTVSVPLGG